MSIFGHLRTLSASVASLTLLGLLAGLAPMSIVGCSGPVSQYRGTPVSVRGTEKTPTPTASPFAPTIPIPTFLASPTVGTMVATPSPAMMLTSAETTVGRTATVQLVARSLPTGLAGYAVAVGTTSPGSCAIAAQVGIRQGVGLIKSLESNVLTVTIIDLPDVWRSGAANEVLLSVLVRGLAVGECVVQANVTRMDDDEGDPIQVGVLEGKVIVR